MICTPTIIFFIFMVLGIQKFFFVMALIVLYLMVFFFLVLCIAVDKKKKIYVCKDANKFFLESNLKKCEKKFFFRMSINIYSKYSLGTSIPQQIPQTNTSYY